MFNSGSLHTSPAWRFLQAGREATCRGKQGMAVTDETLGRAARHRQPETPVKKLEKDLHALGFADVGADQIAIAFEHVIMELYLEIETG